MSNGSSRKKAKESTDEVEELLKAAQDDMLLKLSLNSHIARSDSSSQTSAIDSDLDGRFEALKSKKPKSKLSTTPRIDSDKNHPEKAVNNFDESDDLFARFAALKNPLSSHSSSSVSAIGIGQRLKGGERNTSDNEEDEVEKLINWAIDAARLDPSPPSHDDDDDNDDAEDDSDTEEDSDDEDNDKVDARKKSKRK